MRARVRPILEHQADRQHDYRPPHRPQVTPRQFLAGRVQQWRQHHQADDIRCDMDRREPRQQGHDQPGDHQRGRSRDAEPAGESRDHLAQHHKEQDCRYTMHAADLACSVHPIGADQTSRRAIISLYVATVPVAVSADWNKRRRSRGRSDRGDRDYEEVLHRTGYRARGL